MASLVFLCIANSARSQMAEGLARATAPAGWQVHSAGSRPASVHPHAIDVMREVGIDISAHQSKGLDAVPLASADVVITLCAEQECPVAFTRGRREAWPLPDPAQAGLGEERDAFRRVRDELAGRLEVFWRAVAAGWPP